MSERGHKLSCFLKSITKETKGYKGMVRDALIDIFQIDAETGKRCWEEFSWKMSSGTIRTDKFKSFPDYLHKWSDFQLEDLQKLFSDDKEILVLLSPEIAVYGNQLGENNSRNRVNIVNSVSTDGGNSSTYTISRLKRDRQDLVEKIVKGELSPNGAAIEAGFRNRMIQIPETIKADALAIKIIDKFGPEFTKDLVNEMSMLLAFDHNILAFAPDDQ